MSLGVTHRKRPETHSQTRNDRLVVPIPQRLRIQVPAFHLGMVTLTQGVLDMSHTITIDHTNTVELWHKGWSYSERRHEYLYRISDRFAVIFESGPGDLIYSGVDADVDEPKAMATLLAFLDACAEANEGSENADLFPEHVKAWAEELLGDIAVARMELEESED
ncbi:hypothetical protein BIZ70_gp009 [Gordonia phage JSwag]|uniref:hypothetical protein n=1 Tax=Gordonia phage JSwag TaxID=1887649 RepID=UPI00084F6232|nr:hypothetical protein BIZ70_gp009 [Gordonia phage JSwag]AOE44514.1 hypothetical protein SEA_JSWAG_104 [Gordonia phage JSwag]